MLNFLFIAITIVAFAALGYFFLEIKRLKTQNNVLQEKINEFNILKN